MLSALLVFVLIFGLSWVCVKHFNFALMAILLCALANAWFISEIEIKVSDYSIYLQDIVFCSLFIAAVINAGKNFSEKIQPLTIVWLFYGVLLFTNFVQGYFLVGTTAVVDFRFMFYFWCGVFYFMQFTFSSKDHEKMYGLWYLVGFGFLAVVYFRFYAEYLGLDFSSAWADPTGVSYRVVTARSAYILGAILLVLSLRYFVFRDSQVYIFSLLLFLIAVIGVQHRSVWASVAFPLAIALVLNSRGATLVKLGAFSVALLFLTLFLSKFGDITQSVKMSADKAMDLSTGTFGSRREAWQLLLQNWYKQNLMTQLFGEPFGVGYAGQVRSPHNFYLQNLLRSGVFGILLLLIMYVSLLIKWIRRASAELISQRSHIYMYGLLIIGMLAYYIPYGSTPEQGIILGVAISAFINADLSDYPDELHESQNGNQFTNLLS